MTFFADSVDNLRYERGVVSFRLYASASEQSGVDVCLSCAEFMEVAKSLTGAVPKIEAAHKSWLKMELDRPAERSVAPEQDERGPLGKRVASV